MKRILLTILFVFLATAAPSQARAAGAVSVCDESHLLAALSGGGTVTFTCSGTINLTNTIGISSDTTLDGSGQNVTISGSSAYHVLNLANGITFNLVNITIANGYGGPYTSGGGLDVPGFTTANLTGVTFTNNSASNGGAIINNGDLNIVDSTFSYNHAFGTQFSFNGGAIFNGFGGAITISGSTFIGNGSNTGGAIYSLDGSITISNSTFSGNYADPDVGGAIKIVDGASLDVYNSTFAGNSAGAFGGGAGIDAENAVVTLTNTIMANPSDGQNCTGTTFTDGGGNLSYPDATCPGANGDPLLGALQDNGGPTLTILPGDGSAAIDTGDDAVCAAAPVNGLDQRGYDRPVGAHCDAGAVESSAAPPAYEIYLPLILRESP